MLRSLHLDFFQQEAAKELAGARKKALLRRIGALLRRPPSSNLLLSFDEAAQKLSPWRQAYLGRRTVPVESIVGSEGRYTDFDDEFLPLQDSSEEKWKSVYAAIRCGEELPPVSLLKVGDAYFVRDGNHRVSVARWLGVEALDAEVVELHAAVPIEGAISARDLPEGRRHLHPSERPPYRPPAVGGGRSDRSTRARRGRFRTLHLLDKQGWIGNEVSRRPHKEGVNPRGDDVRPVRTVATRKEALPTCATRRPTAPKMDPRSAGRCRRSMRQARRDDSGKRRPTRTMVAASSGFSKDLL